MILTFDKLPKILDLGFYQTQDLYTHPTRRLDWNVFLYVAEGEMQVWEEETEYVVKKGQFLFLESGLYHWGEPKTPAGTAWYWIHFYPQTISEKHQEMNNHIVSNKLYQISEEEYCRFIELPKHDDLPNHKLMEKKLSSMVEIFCSSDSYRAVTLSLDTLEFLLYIHRELSEKTTAKKSEKTVNKIMRYLENKEKYHLDSKEIGRYANVNYSYLCDVFKEKTGMTIHMYNSCVFVEKAVAMMQNTDMNISEISDSLGFKNPFYFSRVFKKVTGCAPSNYVKRIY